MKRVITDDKLDACLFLAGAMAATTMMARNTDFIKKLLDDALDFMDGEGKARTEAVSSDITRAGLLLERIAHELASLGEETQGDGGADEDDE
ncbi:MAG: hypothetical protein ACYCDN_00640 [Schaalia turicensis]